MLKRSLIILLLLGLFSIWSSSVSACEPCGPRLGFEETANQADEIIIGQRVMSTIKRWLTLNVMARGSEFPEYALAHDGSSVIDVEVFELLKGRLLKDRITVHAFSGMCPYGMAIPPDTQFVMLLKKATVDRRFEYDVVSDCAVKALPIRDGMVVLSSEWDPKTGKVIEKDVLSVDDFVAKLGPGVSRRVNHLRPYYSHMRRYNEIVTVIIILIILLLVIVGVLWYRSYPQLLKKKKQ